MESDPPEPAVTGAEVPAPASSSCKNAQVEDSDVSSIDDQDELVLRPVRKKRPNRRYTEWSSDDDYCLRALKRSYPKYKEADSSSESEADFRPVRDSALRPTGLPIGVVRGCPKCNDCQAVLARWRPQEGCKPSVDEAPVFYPSEEEFKDTLKYIAKIRPEAEPFGICRVVPPPGWQPPCPLRENNAKLHVLKFPTRVQEIHKLQVRSPVRKCSQVKQRLGGRRGRGGFRGRMGRPCRRTPNLLATGGPTKSVEPDESFGFEPGSFFSLSKFEKYAEQFKEQYFGNIGVPDEPELRSDSASRVNPSVDAIEAEYWRIVEQPTEQIEVLYGADVETGSFGSGFPKAKPGDTAADPNTYEGSGWNLNNIARLPGSILAFEEGDISGVLVPWLYVGMCFSSFCWHVEDHHFYSLNYLHWGAPKVWYAVAGHAAQDMESAMRKHLPDLFDEQPDLLHKLVTQLSPSILKGEGLPVYRLVQQAGDFVITFPRAYHSGFNCGFNCAEAVNLAPVDWLPHGQSAVELYREQRRKTSVSHDKLLLAAAREAVVQIRNERGMEKHLGRVVKQEVNEDWEQSGTSEGGKGIEQTKRACCGEGGVLPKALKARVDLEHLRQSLLAGEVQMRKMDRCYDATDERECVECHYDLHLSAVGCVCCPEKYVCLGHVALLCDCQWGRKFVMYRYDLAELELLVAALEGQPGALTTWFEHEQCSSSASSISTHSFFSHQDPGVVRIVGPSDLNSLESPGDKVGYKEQTVEASSAGQREYLIPNPRILEAGYNRLSDKLFLGDSTFPLRSYGATVINNKSQVQPVHGPTAAVLDEMRKIAMGPQTKTQLRISSEQTRSQLRMSSQGKRFQDGSVKIDKQAAVISIFTNRQEVIELSDDEEGTVTANGVGVSPATKSSEGKKAESHSLSSTAPLLAIARSATLPNPSVRGVDGEFPHNVAPLKRQALVQDSVGDVVPGLVQTPCGAVPQRTVSMPTSTLAQMPSMDTCPPLRVERLDVAARKESTIISSLPSRVKSIGNLKQQARAVGTHHLGPGSRLMNPPADHLQRLQSGQEMSQAELCGYVPTIDIQSAAVIQAGNAVQARTPIRLDRPSGPRVAKVLRKKVCCDIELLNVGSIILREGWHDKRSIFPAGFKSRTSFCNVLNISQTCFYLSEIVECGQTGPRFKVSVENNSTAAFVDDSIDVCWQAVQEQINAEIIRRRGIGETNLPALQPPQSLHGLDMFGLSTAAIVQAVEALDPERRCAEYWTEKWRNSWLAGPPGHTEHRPSTPEEVCVIRPKVSGPNEEVTSRPNTPTKDTLLSKDILTEYPPKYPSNGNVDLYSLLKSFFQRGKSDELWALHRLFSCDWQGKEWREGYQALTDILESRTPKS